ncbi:CAP Gly-rich domain-containing protein [Phlyctochytrium arcticum]|nr:CAP Gly-rich domain-containing protein [Phlyctochytrium arcticum]
MLVNTHSNPIVTLFVSSEGAASERRFDKATTIGRLKERLEPITGVPVGSMKVLLYTSANELAATLSDEDKMLGYYPVDDFMRLEVVDTNPRRRRNEYTDVSQVEKFEITDTEYDKRTDSVRAFMQRNKMGKFADQTPSEVSVEEEYAEQAEKLKVGDRCEVEPEAGSMAKRGVVMYVGKVEFKPGFWVGVKYDEPLGKHNGTVQGKSYFECAPKHGAFVRPNKLKVGDFPEVDIFGDDELDEM